MIRPRFWWLGLLCVPAFVCGFAPPSHAASQQEILSLIEQNRIGQVESLIDTCVTFGEDSMVRGEYAGAIQTFQELDVVFAAIINSQRQILTPRVRKNISRTYASLILSQFRSGQFEAANATERKFFSLSSSKADTASFDVWFQKTMAEERRKQEIKPSIEILVSKAAAALLSNDSIALREIVPPEAKLYVQLPALMQSNCFKKWEWRFVDVILPKETIRDGSRLIAKVWLKSDNETALGTSQREGQKTITFVFVSDQWQIESL